MEQTIERQKRAMLERIEAHAGEMRRRLDELMASHEALAQNMTRNLQASYARLEQLAQEGCVSSSVLTTLTQCPSNARKMSVSTYEEGKQVNWTTFG